MNQNQTKKTGLYIHVPFCAQKCHYCDFTITTQKSKENRLRYLNALKKEIYFLSDTHSLPEFETIYLGGGTPSLLEPGEVTELLTFLRKTLKFVTQPEITCEANPEDLSGEKIKTYQSLGINRISLGVQTLEAPQLKTLGRSHSRDDVFKAVDLLREQNFLNYSLDLMLSLPEQTVQDLKSTVEKVLELSPKQVTLYDLEVFPKTYFGKLASRNELRLPAEETHFLMCETAEQMLLAHGFEHYELSSFAKPGYASRHNLLYWHNQDYLGVGPGAHSHFKNKRFVLAETVSRYLDKCERGDFDYDFQEDVEPRQREVERLITGLRLLEGVSVESFSLIREDLDEKIARLEADGLIQLQNNALRLTIRGRYLAEETFAALLA